MHRARGAIPRVVLEHIFRFDMDQIHVLPLSRVSHRYPAIIFEPSIPPLTLGMHVASIYVNFLMSLTFIP